jgi:hypothetical protein
MINKQRQRIQVAENFGSLAPWASIGDLCGLQYIKHL